MLISLVVRLYRPPYIMFTSFPRPLASLEVERARLNQRMLAGIAGTGREQDPKKFLVVVREISVLIIG